MPPPDLQVLETCLIEVTCKLWPAPALPLPVPEADVSVEPDDWPELVEPWLDGLVLSCAMAHDRPSSRTESNRKSCRILNLQMNLVSIPSFRNGRGQFATPGARSINTGIVP